MTLALNTTRAWVGVAVATLTATVAVSPAQAAAIAPGSTLNLTQLNPGAGVNVNSTQINFFGPGITGTQLVLGSQFGTAPLLERSFNPDGSGAVTIGASTGDFASFNLGAGLIKDLSRPNPTATQRNDFLRLAAVGINLSLPVSFPTWTLRFDLDTFTVTSAANQPFAAAFTGFFDLNGVLTPGIGQLTGQSLSNPTSYSLSITAVPTPALLPGLIGFGVAALRKRKAEQFAHADAEA